MNNMYNIEIQTAAQFDMEDWLVESILDTFGCGETDIDERGTYNLILLFDSEDNPEKIQSAIKMLLADRPEIFYIDLFFIRSGDIEPVRKTFCQNGEVITYKTHVIYEVEDE